jgi:hypothetical protein
MSNADLIAEARAARGGRFYGPISDDPSVLDLIARLADALESAERAVAFERLRQVDEALEASESHPAPLLVDSREALAAAIHERFNMARGRGGVAPLALADALLASGVVSLAADRDRVVAERAWDEGFSAGISEEAYWDLGGVKANPYRESEARND